MGVRALLAAIAAGGLLALSPSAGAAPCPGAAACPYASVQQIAAPPTESELRSPGPVAVGPGGVLWVADYATRRVMRFAQDGTYQGSLGAGVLQGFTVSVAASPATGDVYVVDGYPSNRVMRFASDGRLLTTLGTGTGLGQVSFPTGIAVRPGLGPKAGRVYVSDSANGGRIQSFTGALDSPVNEGEQSAFQNGQLAFDPSGIALWTIPGSNTLSRFNPDELGAPALATACPSGSLLGQCQMEGNPATLGVDGDGQVWVADRANDRIQRFDGNGANPTAWGSTGGGDLGFVRPWAAAVSGASLFVTDTSGRLRRFDRATMALQFTFGGPSPAGLRFPHVALAPGGEILQFDGGAGIIRRTAPSGATLANLGQLGLGAGQFSRGIAIATDPGGNLLVLDRDGTRLQKLTPGGAPVWSRGPFGFGDPDGLYSASGVATAPNGEIFVANSNGRNVVVFSPGGTVARRFGSDGTGDGQFKRPTGIVVDDGSVYVLDQNRGDVQRFTLDGGFVSKFGAPGGGPGEFLDPRGIAADGRGSLYVLDAGNARVVVFGRDGSARGAFGAPGGGPGEISAASAIAADGGAVVVSEASGRVQRFALPQPGPPPPGGPPGASGAPKPRPFSAAAAFGLPSVKRCLARGAKLRLRFLKPKGVSVERVEVFVGKRRIVRRTGAKARRTIELRAPRKGRSFALRLRVTPRGGKAVSLTRTYRLCPRR